MGNLQSQRSAAQGSSNAGTGNVSSSAAVPLDQQWESVDMRYEECKAGRGRQAGRQQRQARLTLLSLLSCQAQAQAQAQAEAATATASHA